MIPDERLKAFAEYEKGILDDWELLDVANEVLPDMATELQTSRQTIKRLVEDGERLANKYITLRNNCPDMLVEEARECISNTNAAILIQCLADMDNVIDQHIALMKELEEKK